MTDFVRPGLRDRTRLPSPTKRHYGRYPGCWYRLDSKGRRRYGIDYHDSNGNRVIKTLPLGTTEKDARRERAQILERMHKGERVVRSTLTVGELITEYLETQTGHLKDSTVSGYTFNLKHWVVPELGNRKVAECTKSDIQRFIVHMKSKGFKTWTVRGCLTPLSQAFDYAIDKGWIGVNPVSQVPKSKRPKADQKKMEILSSDEINSLLKASKDSVYYLLFLCAIFTGLRKSELLNLTWEMVDLPNGHVTVSEGKTHAASRTVVLPDFLVRRLAQEDETEGRLFPFQKDNVNRALTACLKKAKVKHVRFHDLRHTYASWMISKGADGVYLADQMGHANPNITYKIYAKLFDPAKKREEMRKKMNEFAEIVG